MKKGLLIGAVITPVLAIVIYFYCRLSYQRQPTKVSDHAASVSERPKPKVVASSIEDGGSFGGSMVQESEKGPSSSPASSPDIAISKKVENYVEQAGIAAEFNGIDDLLERQMDMMVQQNSELSDSEKEKMASLFANHIRGDDMLGEYKKSLSEEFTGDELDRLSELMNDPVMRKMQEAALRMEDLDATPEATQKQAEEYFKDLQNNPPDPARQEAVSGIVDQSNQGEFMADLMLNMVDSLGSQLGENKDQMKENRPQMIKEISENIKMGLMYQTRDFSDEQMRRLWEIKTSPLGVRENKVRQQVANEKTRALFQDLGKVFNENRKK